MIIENECPACEGTGEVYEYRYVHYMPDGTMMEYSPPSECGLCEGEWNTDDLYEDIDEYAAKFNVVA